MSVRDRERMVFIGRVIYYSAVFWMAYESFRQIGGY